jgi:uncharacterized Zn finger protein
MGRFDRRPAKPTANPRRVVGGVRLSARKPGQTPWVVQRWMRLVETMAPGDQLAEGLEYARLGQTRSLDLTAGTVIARVQGRMPRAYSVALRVPMFTHEQWEPVIDAMLAQARYSASLLAGELPPNIEDLFIPVGLRLFPADPSDIAVSCSCALFTGGGAGAAPSGNGGPAAGVWCKHACCTMAIVADRLSTDPFLIFTLRGMPQDELIERLRQRRAAAGSARSTTGAIPIYTPHLPGIADRPAAPLEECVASFWGDGGAAGATAGAAAGIGGDPLSRLDLPITPPDVSHPILRRVGPSPFTGARFPLAGLLATCYDMISKEAIDAEAPPELP